MGGLPTMTSQGRIADDVLAHELAVEQAHSDVAHARLDELRAEADRALASAERTRGGTHQAVFERDVFAHAAATRRAELDNADEGLVFGRIDEMEGSTLHIGRIGVRTAELDPLVVDWRAPAAAAFYRATPVEPLGVARRRTITSRGRTVTGINDELLDASADLEESSVIGEGSFLTALARERGPHMRDIAATIAREQDEIIRAADSGAVLVTGGPGTGKTAVALHRVAYLMYAHRERYSRRGVLVVGPSGVFIRYIGQVLPTLGETSATLASLGQLVPGSPATLTDSPDVAVAKGSAAMAGVLRRTVDRVATGRPVRELRLTYRGQEVVVGVGAIEGRFRQLSASSRGHNSMRRAAASALGELVWSAWSRAAGARDWRADTRAALREELAYALADDSRFRTALDSLWPILTGRQVLDALRSGAVPLESVVRGGLRPEQVNALRDAWAGNAWPTSREASDDDDDLPASPALTVADVALLDELVDQLGETPSGDLYGAPEEEVEEEPSEIGEVTTFADRTSRRAQRAFDEAHRGYAHIVVDEAQDVSPMQWRMLSRRGRGATWTVVGDWAQSSWADVSEVREALHAAAGRRGLTSYELTTNYRTTGSVAELAARVLRRLDPALTPPTAVRDRGDEVEVISTDDLPSALRDAVATVLTAVPGTVGVIAPHTLASDARDWLGALDPRLAVVDPWEAKGLEYDGCVVLAPEALVAETTAGMRALYVAVTRATRRLVIVSRLPDPIAELVG
ncbi:MAG: hypothetical protein QOJ92_1929 [Frankiales bacterium]|nr:hypothetical protein [Frankiales bacterium]